MTPAIIVHGGAGKWSDAGDDTRSNTLKKAASTGWEILINGGSALDAVEKATNILEDEPLFDAGIGSFLNADGVVEMDALLIDAARRDFGAVAGVQHVQHAISLARRVLDDTPQNFFVGTGADKLAQQLGIPLVSNLSLVSDAEWEAFQRGENPESEGHDTVGAVAIDQHGNIAAATSTGGTARKPAGRVGDSPMFGAGGYADNDLGGAGATGKGEHSMRVLLSQRVVNAMTDGRTAQAAADAAVAYTDALFDESNVGVICVDKSGNLGAAHTTEKLACGWIDANGNPQATMRGGVVIGEGSL